MKTKKKTTPRRRKKLPPPPPPPPVPVDIVGRGGAKVPLRILPPLPLTAEVQVWWDLLVEDLHERPNWAAQDRHALYILADSLHLYHEARRRTFEDGIIVVSKGDAVKHPAVTIMNSAWDRVCKLFAAFGLHPTGRLALKLNAAKVPSFDDLLGGDEDDDE